MNKIKEQSFGLCFDLGRFEWNCEGRMGFFSFVEEIM